MSVISVPEYNVSEKKYVCSTSHKKLARTIGSTYFTREEWTLKKKKEVRYQQMY